MGNDDFLKSLKERKIAAQQNTVSSSNNTVTDKPSIAVLLDESAPSKAGSRGEVYKEEGKRRADERKAIDAKAAAKKIKKYSTSVGLTGDMLDKYNELRSQFRPYGCLTYEKIIFGGLKYLEKMSEQERSDFMSKFN